jgi:putative PIN family toxin of toxin-antitoxin system
LKPFRAVVDTNILVSALLRRSSVPGQVLDLVLVGELTALVDHRLLSEYRDVLARPKFKFEPADISAVIQFLESNGELITEPRFAGALLPDPDDLPFAEVAFGGGADLLITGNAKHFPVGRAVRVVTPREFVEIWKSVGILRRLGLDDRQALEPNEPYEVAMVCRRCRHIRVESVLGLKPDAEPRREQFGCIQPDASQPGGRCGGELWTYDNNQLGRGKAAALGLPTPPSPG